MKIIGIGSALPSLCVPNTDLEPFLDTSDEWIRTRTGIECRHILKDETLSELAATAAKRALEDAGIIGSDLDLIIGITTQGDYIFPAMACTVQKALDAACPCMDVHAACTGFLYAMDLAEAYLLSGKAKNILLLSAEGMSRLCNWSDRSTSVLFGDASAAMVVSQGDSLLSIRLTTQGDTQTLHGTGYSGNCPFSPHVASTPGITMAGQDVFKFAVSHSAEDMLTVAGEAKIPLSDIRWFILHQANRRILESVRQRLKLTGERFPSNIHRVGNTSSASIPLLVDTMYRLGKLHPGDLMMFSAFGAGLSTAACLLRWDKAPPSAVIADDDNLLFYSLN